jgi:uncharacterized integral membrane protein
MKIKILIASSIIAFIFLIYEGLNLTEMLKRFNFVDGMPPSFYRNNGFKDHIGLGKDITKMKIYFFITLVILIVLLIMILILYLNKRKQNITLNS